MTTNISTIESKNQHFPNGLDVTAYAGWESWDYRKWAWEFLRRNDAFRHACNSLPSEKVARMARKRDISGTFGLRRFKHYIEAYDEGKPAQFRALAVSPRPINKSLAWSRELRNDEVCIVFKLRPSLFGTDALDLQMKMARRIIERRADVLRTTLRVDREATAPRPAPSSLFRKLRLLDARRLDISWEVIAETLRTRPGQDLFDLAEAERKAYDSAAELADYGYLALLTSKFSRRGLQPTAGNASNGSPDENEPRKS
ncbi:transcriptional regulator domain-containing protein [Burkholderia cepacia]|uniref:transcriptional regulator domain-containing protein n=1 Tax=Burkholderia cepacia TaxID=292 RepID=UPI000F5A4931|nr:hypothetical protein [Burkholderia cepacia]